MCMGCLGAWVYVVCNHIQGVNVMTADGVGQWMWAVGEIGTGLGNVLGNQVVCLFLRYPSRDASLKALHWYPSGTLCPLRRHIGILLGHSVR